MGWLRDLRVVDFSTGIAGAYATKLLCDAGADVVKLEPPGGDPLRHHASAGVELGDRDGALFEFLAAGKRSIVARPGEPEADALARGADLVVESFAPSAFDAEALARSQPGLVVLSITPFGRTGPWRDRPASEFTLQAESGSIGTRGLPGREPFQAGGRITEWVGGTFAAVAALAAVQRARRSGHGEHVDFSLLELMTVVGTNYMDLAFRLLGIDRPPGSAQSVETPSIEPTADGYVGFCTNSRQQISDFMLLIERSDLREDAGLAQIHGRVARLDEWNEIVHAWTRRHSTEEIIRKASLLRIPVAPVNDGDGVRRHEQLRARGVLRDDPTGRFQCPRPPYRIDGRGIDERGIDDAGIGDAEPPPMRPAPVLGEHTRRVEPRTRVALEPTRAPGLPLDGVRVLDMTAWWAGPSATHMLAALGAEVIHLESVTRLDGIRMTGGMLARRYPDWWEASAFFQAVNTNKLGLTIDLAQPRGREVGLRLIGQCDAVVENYTPRVLEGFDLGWDVIHRAAPRTILVRMPAFGLTGPWRDHPGFAQTMEQLTGLAWVTGHVDDQPRIQRGPCDPLAGMHAAFALLVALEAREATGVGSHVECTMVEGALNAAAEVLIERTAYGVSLQRMGNRSPHAAPQGLYACGDGSAELPSWLALSVETDAHWEGLVKLLGSPDWAQAPELASLRGRIAAHDTIDDALRRWAAAGERDALVALLLEAGVPAAVVADPRRISECPQHRARGFYEAVEHPVVGRHPLPSVPFRYASVDRWLRRPAPTLGQHNHALLGELLGLDADELTALEAEGVIGTRPSGA